MTNAQGMASVVITNRDYARFLTDAVDSALAQVDTEVIVVDDGSTDDSLAVLEDYGSRIRTCVLSGVGQAGAMHAGFAASTGDPVLFLDADDRLAPGIVDEVRRHLGDPAVGRVHFPLRRIDADGDPAGTTVPPEPSSLPVGDLRQEVLDHVHDLRWQPTTGNAYRRAVLDAILPMPVEAYRICADHYLNALSSLHGAVARSDMIGGDYRVHGANADAREHFDPERVRGLVARATVTERELRRAAVDLGLSPGADRSVSAAANRLVSLRLDPAQHPRPGDSRRRAWSAGVVALARRRLAWHRRILGIGLLTAFAVVPRRAVPALAERTLGGATAPVRPRRSVVDR